MHKSNKNRKAGVIAILIVIIMAVVLAVSVIIVFKAETVTVTGNEICDEDEIRKVFTSGPLGDNTLVIKLRDKLGAFESIPFIRDADITVVDRNTVNIQVYEKSLIACFYYMGQYIYFDKDGMILETTNEKMDNIPCIEGISFTNFTLNEIIAVEEEGQIDMILDLSELINHYSLDVDRVVFSNKNEVTLYCGGIKVFLGNKSLYDQQIASVSDVIRKSLKKGMSGTIDMRNYQRGDKIILKSNK